MITGMPSEDRRAKEALRIAAGISPWGKVHPTVCFKNGIGQMEDPEIKRYLTLLDETGSNLFTLSRNLEKPLKTIKKSDLEKLQKNTPIILQF
ncbi:MAG: hypothetical protein CMO70_02275 [Verrucomicrobiales bacterium]|nr:hypothetical protein [Verrucomicrobiales bacterium]